MNVPLLITGSSGWKVGGAGGGEGKRTGIGV